MNLSFDRMDHQGPNGVEMSERTSGRNTSGETSQKFHTSQKFPRDCQLQE